MVLWYGIISECSSRWTCLPLQRALPPVRRVSTCPEVGGALSLLLLPLLPGMTLPFPDSSWELVFLRGKTPAHLQAGVFVMMVFG